MKSVTLVVVTCLLLLIGCAIIPMSDGTTIAVLGKTHVEQCTTGTDGVKKCITLETDHFPFQAMGEALGAAIAAAVKKFVGLF